MSTKAIFLLSIGLLAAACGTPDAADATEALGADTENSETDPFSPDAPVGESIESDDDDKESTTDTVAEPVAIDLSEAVKETTTTTKPRPKLSADLAFVVEGRDLYLTGEVNNCEPGKKLTINYVIDLFGNEGNEALDCSLGDVTVYHRMGEFNTCLLYTSPSPRDATLSRMPSSA